MHIRPATIADADAIGCVHAQCWLETYPGIVPEEVLARVSASDRVARWRERLQDPLIANGLFVAVDDTNAVVGFAHCGPQRDAVPEYTGELYALYILRMARGRGAGRALVRVVADWLVAQGYPAMFVWVLAANAPARRF